MNVPCKRVPLLDRDLDHNPGCEPDHDSNNFAFDYKCQCNERCINVRITKDRRVRNTDLTIQNIRNVNSMLT